MVMKDATPLMTPCTWAELIFKCKQIQSMIHEDQKKPHVTRKNRICRKASRVSSPFGLLQQEGRREDWPLRGRDALPTGYHRHWTGTCSDSYMTFYCAAVSKTRQYIGFILSVCPSVRFSVPQSVTKLNVGYKFANL